MTEKPSLGMAEVGVSRPKLVENAPNNLEVSWQEGIGTLDQNSRALIEAMHVANTTTNPAEGKEVLEIALDIAQNSQRQLTAMAKTAALTGRQYPTKLAEQISAAQAVIEVELKRSKYAQPPQKAAQQVEKKPQVVYPTEVEARRELGNCKTRLDVWVALRSLGGLNSPSSGWYDSSYWYKAFTKFLAGEIGHQYLTRWAGFRDLALAIKAAEDQAPQEPGPKYISKPVKTPVPKEQVRGNTINLYENGYYRQARIDDRHGIPDGSRVILKNHKRKSNIDEVNHNILLAGTLWNKRGLAAAVRGDFPGHPGVIRVETQSGPMLQFVIPAGPDTSNTYYLVQLDEEDKPKLDQLLAQPAAKFDREVAPRPMQKFTYGAAESIGRRESMEDAHQYLAQFMNDPNSFYVGVYDGHGSNIVARHAANHLHTHLARFLSQGLQPDEALRQAYLETHNTLRSLTDGATAVTALLKDGYLYVANAGDARAVLSRNGNQVPLSTDHKASDPIEQDRMRRAGYFVSADRVYKGKMSIAVARALGDKAFQGPIIPDPNVQRIRLNSNDEFLILACDGVWDVMKNQDAVDFIRWHISQGEKDPQRLSQLLVQRALNLGSSDNITVNLVLLNQ